MKNILLFLFFLISFTQNKDCGIFIPQKIKWEKPPIENWEFEYADAEVLYFSPKKIFKKFQYTLVKNSNGILSLADAEGGNIYIGTWVQKKDTILIKYKLHSYMLNLPDLKKDTTYTDTLFLLNGINNKKILKYDSKIFVNNCNFSNQSYNFIIK
jgi:hypothetical protein